MNIDAAKAAHESMSQIRHQFRRLPARLGIPRALLAAFSRSTNHLRSSGQRE